MTYVFLRLWLVESKKRRMKGKKVKKKKRLVRQKKSGKEFVLL